MKEDYKFRNGHPEDVKQLAALGLASYGQFQNILPEQGWKKMGSTCGDENTYIQLLKIGQAFVCVQGNEIIGMAFLIPSGNPVAFFLADWAYIRLVGVKPGYEGQGIGRKLTQLCIDFSKQSGEKTLALHTSEFQNAARHIYESMGFTKLKELDKIYEKRYWLYTLQLENEEHEITYHRAALKDIDDLIALRIAFAFDLIGEQNERTTKKVQENLRTYFEEALKLNTSIWYLAKQGETIAGVGGMLIRINPPNYSIPDGRQGYLVNMYTVPAFRRKGICSTLMKLLVKAGENSGIKAFELHATKEGEFVYQQEEFKIHDEPTYRRYL